MSAKRANLNNDYAYWQQKINYGQEMAYANSVRNFELSNAITNAEEVFRARSSSAANYAVNSQAMNEAFAQQSMADAMSLYQYNAQALRQSSAVQAAAQEGRSTDRLVNDYARQVGDMAALQEMNEGFRSRQLTREQAGMVANYLQQYNSQQFYQEQQVFDPVMPFPPLATLVDPTPPSFVGAAPNAGTAFLGSAIGAVSTGFNTYQGMKSYTNSGKRG